MFRKKYEFEDEKPPIPVIWTVVVAVLFLVSIFGAAYWVTGVAEKHEIERQYEYVEE